MMHPFTAVAVLPLLSLASGVVLELPMKLDNGYCIVEVDIGTPAKTYRLMFDTGSASTWVVDDKCTKDCSNISGYQRIGYNVNVSSTSSLTGQYGSIEYSGGAVSGPTATDLFQWNDFEWNQTFLAASQSNWAAMPSDGFLGLAFSAISVGGADTVVETLLPLLDEPRFSIFYDPAASPDADSSAAGHVTIGDSHEGKYIDGPIMTIPIVSRDGQYQVWRSRMASIVGTDPNDKTETSTDFGSGNVVFDTGGGGIILPSEKIESVYESIGMNWTALVNGHRVLMCTDFNSSWSVSFEFGPFEKQDDFRTVTLTGDQFARPGFPAKEGACWPPFEEGGFTLLGKSFLSKFYSVWDFGGRDVASYQPTLSLGHPVSTA